LALNIFSFILLVGQPEPIALGDAVLKVAIVTLFIAVVGFGAAIWLRTIGKPSSSNSTKRPLNSFFRASRDINEGDQISLVSSRKIAQGQSLLVVKWKGKSFLLGSTTANITCLAVEADQENLDLKS